MFDNYDQLKTQVRSFLWDRPDVEAQIPAFIQLAESEMRRLLRTRQTTDAVPFTISSSKAGIPCSARSIQAVKVSDDGSDQTRDLEYVAPETWSTIGDSARGGRPRFYTIQNDRLYFWPVTDESLSGTLVYIDPFCPLSATNKTNWVLKRHPDIYLCGALKWGKAWLIDADQDWGSPFYAAINSANHDDPRVSFNTKVRADDVTILGSRRRFDIRAGRIF